MGLDEALVETFEVGLEPLAPGLVRVLLAHEVVAVAGLGDPGGPEEAQGEDEDEARAPDRPPTSDGRGHGSIGTRSSHGSPYTLV
ncbi:hypothetical protein GCM10009790_00490 [Georgenia ruanii]